MAADTTAKAPVFDPILCVVDFHHARGPEVEHWIGVEEGEDPAMENEWPLLPFMALSDGAHAATEDFSYFTLRHEKGRGGKPTSLFGISCTRQLDASQLINRPSDVTRSTVQKAVVVIAANPGAFGHVRERLSVVTTAWFGQKDFTDLDILQRFQESLARTFRDQEEEKDQYFGMSLRELIHEFRFQTLVLFKSCLLQPKMLFFGSHCERLCMMQFSLISLIPGLIKHLQDCADPAFNSYEEEFVRPTSLKTSERASLLAYMGLPLQIFGKGSLFGPYTPLQQLDMLADHGTKSYVVGSTNSLLLQQKDRYSDILINLDEHSINITSASLKNALQLSTPDRRWIDFLSQTVVDTWDETNPSRPKTMGYAGSEEFIRLQFEEYLLALLAAVKYKQFLQTNKNPSALMADIDGDPSEEWNSDWVDAWMKTENFRIFSRFTDSHLFDIVDPKHPCSGGITMEDVQRRLAQQVAELHLDERFQNSREVVGKQLAEGQKKIQSAMNNLWAEIEKRREEQRRKQEEAKAAAAANGTNPNQTTGASRFSKGPDLSQAQASVQAASSRAGAYLSSWGAWAAEKRKAGWGRSPSSSSTPITSPSIKPTDEKRSSYTSSFRASADFKSSSPRASGEEPRRSPRSSLLFSADERRRSPPPLDRPTIEERILPPRLPLRPVGDRKASGPAAMPPTEGVKSPGSIKSPGLSSVASAEIKSPPLPSLADEQVTSVDLASETGGSSNRPASSANTDEIKSPGSPSTHSTEIVSPNLASANSAEVQNPAVAPKTSTGPESLGPGSG